MAVRHLNFLLVVFSWTFTAVLVMYAYTCVVRSGNFYLRPVTKYGAPISLLWPDPGGQEQETALTRTWILAGWSFRRSVRKMKRRIGVLDDSAASAALMYGRSRPNLPRTRSCTCNVREGLPSAESCIRHHVLSCDRLTAWPTTKTALLELVSQNSPSLLSRADSARRRAQQARKPKSNSDIETGAGSPFHHNDIITRLPETRICSSNRRTSCCYGR